MSSYFRAPLYCTCSPYFHHAGPLPFSLFKMYASDMLLYLATPTILPALPPPPHTKKHASMLPYFLSLPLLIAQHEYQGVCPLSSLFWLIPFPMLLLIITTLKQTFLASLLWAHGTISIFSVKSGQLTCFDNEV